MPELAVAILFSVWSRDYQEPSEDAKVVTVIRQHAACDEEAVLREFFCLVYWTTCLGFANGLENERALNGLVSNFHFFQQLMTGSIPPNVSSSQVESGKRFLLVQESGYMQWKPAAWAVMDRAKSYVPNFSLLGQRFDEYQEVLAESGADLQQGAKEVSRRFAGHVGSPKNPVVDLAVMTEIALTAKMIRDLMPKYRLV